MEQLSHRFYDNSWFPRGSGDASTESPLKGEQLCTYGPWVWEEAHGNRPEIHPSELYWWRESDTGPFFLMLLQDDSNRFDRSDNYDPPGGPSWWRPWSKFPRTGEFKIAFAVNPDDDPLIFDIRSLEERNVVTNLDPEFSQDADDGKQHAIEFNAKPVLFATERQERDDDLGVRFDNICRQANTGELNGYLTLTAKIGANDRGGEGFYVLHVNQRQEPVIRQNVRVTFGSVKRLPIFNPNVTAGSFVLRANELASEINLAEPDSIIFLITVTLDFGDVFVPDIDSLRVSAEAKRGWLSIGSNSRSFTSQENFGHGEPRKLTISKFMCMEEEPGCQKTNVNLYEFSYRITVADVPSGPPPLEVVDSQPQVAVRTVIIEDSLRRATVEGQEQLVADVQVRTIGRVGAPESAFTVSSIKLKDPGQSRDLSFSPLALVGAPRQRLVIAKGVPIPVESGPQLELQTAAGNIVRVTIPSVAMNPLVADETLQLDPSDTVHPDHPELPLQKVTRWQYDVMPTYTAVRDGAASLEDDSPVAEELNGRVSDARATGNFSDLSSLFGSEQPFVVDWSFEARDVASGEVVPVIVGEATPQAAVQVVLSQDVIPNDRIQVTFPDEPQRIVELTATMKLRDTFGVFGEAQHRIWSHVVLTGQSEEKVIQGLIPKLTSLIGLSDSEWAAVLQTTEPPIDGQTQNEARLRHMRMLGQIVRRAAEDKRITIDELSVILNSGTRIGP